MRVLSFDPSLRNWGWVVMQDNHYIASGVIQGTKQSTGNNAKDLFKETHSLGKSVQQLVDQYKPDYMVAEFPVGSQSFSAAVSYAACITILSRYPQTIQVTPNQVKTTVGIANATKKDVIQWVQLRHADALLKPNGKLVLSYAEHIADAIAAYYTAIIRGLLPCN